jgi:hypothetical protein
MKSYTWNDINVGQWQQIQSIFGERGNSWLDLVVRPAAIIMDRTEHELDSLSKSEINDIGKQIAFVHTAVEPEAQRIIEVRGKRYRCVYDVTMMPAARYIESKVFGQDVHKELHKVAACMVIPQRRHWLLGWIDDKYDAAKHSEYAEDMLHAPITAVLGSVLFFCDVYLTLINNSRVYLVKELMKRQNLPVAEAEAFVNDLCNVMDGIIRPNGSRITSESQ